VRQRPRVCVLTSRAKTDFAYNHAKEESTKVASSYGKDVTTRATSKSLERRREERILRTLEVFEETNTHGIDNKAGTGHVVGQYQWVDKIYEAQVFNYGKRLLFDLMVPEPAVFLLYAAANAPKAGAELVKPVPFTLSPSELTEWNYASLVRQYEVVGVTPPPAPFVTVGKAVEGATPSADRSATKTLEVVIPDGYQAIAGNVVHTFTWWEQSAAVDFVIGKRGWRANNSSGWFWAFSMDNETGSVGIGLKAFRAEVFTASIELNCKRTQRALDEWKLKTHGAILQAYQKQLRDYEERLAALQIQAAQEIQGRNPVENERLIRSELRKSAISVFTNQHFDLFGAIEVSPQGYPQPDLPEAAAEARYIRFFEQAFEWEQMMFHFHPYYWGRKGNWRQRALLQDVDPLFAEFVKAGAARIVVAVRPGFEAAVAHFLDTGEVWDGADLPPIGSPLYVSIIEEIRERDRAPGAELPQGTPWRCGSRHRWCDCATRPDSRNGSRTPRASGCRSSECRSRPSTASILPSASPVWGMRRRSSSGRRARGGGRRVIRPGPTCPRTKTVGASSRRPPASAASSSPTTEAGTGSSARSRWRRTTSRSSCGPSTWRTARPRSSCSKGWRARTVRTSAADGTPGSWATAGGSRSTRGRAR
jgi:hypothetical protein